MEFTLDEKLNRILENQIIILELVRKKTSYPFDNEEAKEAVKLTRFILDESEEERQKKKNKTANNASKTEN